ncbi:hypothetical protein [Roseivirga sp.]|uniref:hypothetical protein n=1 Tax=Roseivirga sp. TaxID=1964215 RepID=UPI003B8DB279
MKTTIYTLFIIVGLMSSQMPVEISEKGHLEENIEVIFDRKMTFEELVEIRSDLKKKGIDLDYSNLSFDNNHRLKSISFEVDCKDGFSGKADRSSLGSKPFGFFRNFDQGVKVPFGVGYINELR